MINLTENELHFISRTLKNHIINNSRELKNSCSKKFVLQLVEKLKIYTETNERYKHSHQILSDLYAQIDEY